MISITTSNYNALPVIIIICDLLLWSQATAAGASELTTAAAASATASPPPWTTTTTTAAAATITTTTTSSSLLSLTASMETVIIGTAQIIEQTANIITATPKITTTTTAAETAAANITKATNTMMMMMMNVGVGVDEQQDANVGNAQISFNITQQTSSIATVATATAATAAAATTAHTLHNEMSFHQYCLEHRNTIAPLFTLILYTVVCMVGLFGNTLVIYVVLRFSKMQTVTNIYILNLAIADECFLIGIPFLLYTMRICSWRFGDFLCKAYMVNTSIPQFTSSIFLLIMSADRYIAVCHPITSPRYRTLRIAKLISALAWCTSAVLMLPVILYASTVLQEDGVNLSCNIDWPESYERQTAPTFILYTFLLGFATPLTFILVFYCLVLRKLQAVGVKHKSKEKKRSHRKVTRLVLTVITVYVLCWLPYWISQVALISSSPDRMLVSKDTKIIVFLLFGCLSYSNSAMNPILYAFLSDNFRKSFSKAFTCMGQHEVNAQLHAEASILTRQGSRKRQLGNGGGVGVGGAVGARRGGDAVADGIDGVGGNTLIGGQANVKPKQQQHEQQKSQQQQQQLQQKQQQQHHHHSDQHGSSCGGDGSTNNNSSSTTTTTSSTTTGNTVGGSNSTSAEQATNKTASALMTQRQLATSGNEFSNSNSNSSNCDGLHNNDTLMSSPKLKPSQSSIQPEDTILMLRDEQTICAIMERQRHYAPPTVADPMLQTHL